MSWWLRLELPHLRVESGNLNFTNGVVIIAMVHQNLYRCSNFLKIGYAFVEVYCWLKCVNIWLLFIWLKIGDVTPVRSSG